MSVAVKDGIEDLRMGLDRVVFARSLGFDPDPWQGRLLRSECQRVLLNCSRQAGKSTVSAILSLHRAIYHPGSLVLILAPSERQSKELFSKIAAFYRDLGGEAARPSGAGAESNRKLGMVLENGSRIEALPGTEKTVRGFSGASLLIVDEAARLDDGLYHAVRPMLAISGGRLLMLSTPFGKRGVFHDEWTDGGEGWERYEVPARDCPRISAGFLEEERRSLPEWVYRQEYGCEFVETSDQVFGYDLVQSAVSDDVSPLF